MFFLAHAVFFAGCLGALLATAVGAQTTNAIPQPYCVATNAINPSLSPDGRQLAYAALRPAQRIEILDLNTRTNRVLVEDVQMPVWSPDGRWIAYQQVRTVPGIFSRGSLMRVVETMVMAAEGGRPRFVYPGSRPYWSADGQRLFVVDENQGQIVACRVDQAEDQPPVYWTLGTTPLAWISPDGRRVAVLTNENMAVFGREKQELQFLIPVGVMRHLYVAWGHDSQYLIIALGSPEPEGESAGLWWVDLQAQKIHRLAKGEWRACSVAPKGGPLAVTHQSPNQARIWLFPSEWLEARKAGRVPPFEPPPPPQE
jgi:hypothetical protein